MSNVLQTQITAEFSSNHEKQRILCTLALQCFELMQQAQSGVTFEKAVNAAFKMYEACESVNDLASAWQVTTTDIHPSSDIIVRATRKSKDEGASHGSQVATHHGKPKRKRKTS